MSTEDWMFKELSRRDKMFKKQQRKTIVELKKATPEFEVHKSIASYLTVALSPPAFFHTTENSNHQGGTAGLIKQAQNKARGVKAGFPDMLIFYPKGVLALEIKRYGKEATPMQLAMHEQLRANGVVVAVVHDVEEVKALLKIHEIPVSKYF